MQDCVAVPAETNHQTENVYSILRAAHPLTAIASWTAATHAH